MSLCVATTWAARPEISNADLSAVPKAAAAQAEESVVNLTVVNASGTSTTTAYKTIKEALEAGKSSVGQYVEYHIIQAGIYEMADFAEALNNYFPQGLNSKGASVGRMDKIVADVDGVVFKRLGPTKYTTTDDFISTNTNIAFNNITFELGDNTWSDRATHSNGFYNNTDAECQNTPYSIMMEGCSIKGQLAVYGNASFTDCTFESSTKNAYAFWSAGEGRVKLKSCTFNCNDYAVNVYDKKGGGAHYVTVEDCVFNYSIKSSTAPLYSSDYYSMVYMYLSGNNVANSNYTGKNLWNEGGNNKMVFKDSQVVYPSNRLFYAGLSGGDNQGALMAGVLLTGSQNNSERTLYINLLPTYNDNALSCRLDSRKGVGYLYEQNALFGADGVEIRTYPNEKGKENALLDKLTEYLLNGTYNKVFSNIYTFNKNKSSKVTINVDNNAQKLRGSYSFSKKTGFCIKGSDSNMRRVLDLLTNTDNYEKVPEAQLLLKEGAYFIVGNERVDFAEDCDLKGTVGDKAVVKNVETPNYTTATVYLPKGSVVGTRCLKYDVTVTVNVPGLSDNLTEDKKASLQGVFSTLKKKENDRKDVADYLFTEINAIVGLISEQDATITININAKKIASVNGTGYTSINSAINAAEYTEVEILKSGTYDMSEMTGLNNKNVQVSIIAGDGVDVTFVHDGSKSSAIADNISNGITFKGITFDLGNTDNHGFTNSGLTVDGWTTYVEFDDCKIKGKYTTFGNTNFKNCTFEQDVEDYNVDVKEPYQVKFEGCIFNGLNKAIDVNGSATANAKVYVTDCTFNASESSSYAPVDVKAVDAMGNYMQNSLYVSGKNSISSNYKATLGKAKSSDNLWMTNVAADKKVKTKIFADVLEVWPVETRLYVGFTAADGWGEENSHTSSVNIGSDYSINMQLIPTGEYSTLPFDFVFMLNKAKTLGVEGTKTKRTSITSEDLKNDPRLQYVNIDFSEDAWLPNLYSFKGQATHVKVKTNGKSQSFVYTSEDVTSDYQINVKADDNNKASRAWHMITDNYNMSKEAQTTPDTHFLLKEGTKITIGGQSLVVKEDCDLFAGDNSDKSKIELIQTAVNTVKNALGTETESSEETSNSTVAIHLPAGSMTGFAGVAKSYELVNDVDISVNAIITDENEKNTLKGSFSAAANKLISDSKLDKVQGVFGLLNTMVGVISGHEVNVDISIDTPVLTAGATGQTEIGGFEGDAEEGSSQVVTVKGTGLKGDITVELTDENDAFAIEEAPVEKAGTEVAGGKVFNFAKAEADVAGSKTLTIAKADAENENGKALNVTFNPAAAGDYTATLTLKSEGAEDVTIALKGHATATSHDLVITSAQIATLYLDFPVSIPADDNIWCVLYAKNVTDGTLVCYPLKDYIPANTGVIIQGNQGTYTFTKYRGEAIPLAQSALHGVTKETAVSDVTATEGCDGILTLGHGTKSYIGFYSYTGTILPANRAYIPYSLDASAAAKGLQVVVDGEATDIHDINAAAEAGDWYTVSGTKLAGCPTQAGIYIHDGKKVVIK